MVRKTKSKFVAKVVGEKVLNYQQSEPQKKQVQLQRVSTILIDTHILLFIY